MTLSDEFLRYVRLPFLLFVGLVLAAALSGGSNRGDIMIVMVVRLVAVSCLGAAILLMPYDKLRAVRIPLAILAALAAWMAIQLVPLPPSIWTALPGRERLAAAATAAGMPQPWMPISIVRMRTLESLLALLPPAAALVMVAWLPRRTWLVQAGMLAVVGVASGLLALVQLAGPLESQWYIYANSQKGGAAGFFANRNHQVAFLACMFPLLAAISMQALRRGKRGGVAALSSLAVMLFFLPLIFITGSRAGLVLAPAALAATALLVWPLIRGARWPRWWRFAAAGGALVVAAATTAILLSARSLSLQRWFATNIGEEQRVLVVEPIIRLIRQNLPFGTGFGTFDPAFRAIEPYAQLFRTYLNHAHSDPLEFLSDGGLPAGLILLAFLIWWGKSTFFIWFRVRDGEIARAATIATALLMLASLVDYPLRTPLAATLFAILIAWMARAVSEAHPDDSVDTSRHLGRVLRRQDGREQVRRTTRLTRTSH